MIVETMSFKEIVDRYNIIFEEMLGSVNPSPYRRFIIKNRKATNVTFETKKRKIDENSYVLMVPFLLNYRDFMQHGLKGIILLVYGTSTGNMVVSKGWSCKINNYNYTFYTSHFFDRYRERMLKDLSFPKDKVITEYFVRNISRSTDHFEDYKGAHNSFLTVTNEGIALGTQIDSNKLLYKTFIDFESLSKKKQVDSKLLKPLFDACSDLFEKMRWVMSNNLEEGKGIAEEIRTRHLL